MNKQRIYRYLTLAALMGFWSCASTRQTAQNTGEVDDLYGNSGNAVVYADNSSDPSTVAERPSRQQQRFDRQQQRSRNANPDYSDEQQGYDANADEYYAELSARKLQRGLSPDPGWGDNGTNAYNSGFVNGYNAAQTSALSWNRWGFNNTGFWNGFNIGLGFGSFGGWGNPWGYNRFGYGGFYDPFWGPSYPAYAYSPFGFGGGFYDPFFSPYYGYGGFNSFYGGGWGRPVYVNNVTVVGADPYRNSRSYGPRGSSASNRYNNGFVNTPRNTGTNNGGRSGSYSGSGTAPAYTNNGSSGTNGGYYAAPRRNSRGGYYYDNGSGTTSGGRASGNSAETYTNPAPSYSGNTRSNSDYYAAPRQNSRGSYTPPSSSGGYGSGRSGSNQPSYQPSQPSYNAPQRTYSQPSTPSYSSPSPSYSTGGSRGGSSSGGGGYSGGGGGGGRGPR